MTSLNRVDLKAKFESGDAPQGSDYADLIDSFVNLAETTVQTLQGNLAFSGGLSAASVTGGTGTFFSITATLATAQTLYSDLIESDFGSFQTIRVPDGGGNGVASGMYVNCSMDHHGNSYYATGFRIHQTAASVACVSTAQASAVEIDATLNFLRTVATAQNDAVRLPSTYVGATFTVINTTTGSARVFPPSGGTIDGGSTNASIDIFPKGSVGAKVMFVNETSTVYHSFKGS